MSIAPQDAASESGGSVSCARADGIPPLARKVMVCEEHKNQRLDKFLADVLAPVSRSRVQSLIENGHVQGPLGFTTNPTLSRACKVQAGEAYWVVFPPLEEAPQEPQPQTIPLSVIFEDEDMIVVDKPAGMVVHPAPGHWEGTLVNALLAHCGRTLSGISGVKRPGIVHRLDRGTSGLMVVAKHDQAHQSLSQQFSTRSLSRIYWAFVWGETPPSGKVESLMGRHPIHRQKMAVLRSQGREAQTAYKRLASYQHGRGQVSSLLECQLGTGRTHQIRVHLSHIGHGVMGDPLYGSMPPRTSEELKIFFQAPPWTTQRQALHAKALRLQHPRLQVPMSFESPLPPDMHALQSILQAGDVSPIP